MDIKPISIIQSAEEFVFEFASEEDAKTLKKGASFEFEGKVYTIARFYPGVLTADGYSYFVIPTTSLSL